MRFRMFIVMILTIFFAVPCLAYVPDVGEGVCVGNCPEDTPSGGGDDGGYVAPTVYVPSGPSPEELRRQREEKDLEEAALDAGDQGMASYKSGDYASAVKYFSEALEYAPDDPDIQHNLDRAKESLRQSEDGRKLKGVQFTGQAAAATKNEAASALAQLGFDTAGSNARSLDVPAVDGRASTGRYKDPVVAPAQKTWAVTKLEWQREGLKKTTQRLEEQLKKLDPQKDAVKIVEVRQKVTDNDNKIHYLNFSITEELQKAPAPKTEPVKAAH